MPLHPLSPPLAVPAAKRWRGTLFDEPRATPIRLRLLRFAGAWHGAPPQVRRVPGRRHKVTVVGLGAMGRRHVRVLSGLRDRFDVVGAHDVGAEIEWPDGVHALGETDAIARADVVVVATPIRAHAATVARALAAGKHVLVEKPLCARSVEAEALAAAAARGAARLFVGHSERFNPVVRALARLVRDEPVLAIDLQRVGPTRPTDCGVLVNLAVHDFDLAAYLAGGEAVVHGAVGSASSGAGEDLAHVVLTTASGAVGHVYVDRTVSERRRSIALATRRWLYEGDLLAHRLLRTSRETAVRTEVPLPLEEPLVAQAVALADALDGAAPRELATGIDGARALALAERAASYCVSSAPVAQPTGLRGAPR
jgi:predicted dehydrogenase